MEDLESKNTWVFNTNDDGPKWPRFKSEAILRLIIFLIGMIGIIVVAVNIEIVIMIVKPELINPESDLYLQGVTTVNAVQYLVLLGAFISLLWPRLYDLLKRFRYWKHVIVGLGIGAAVIGFTILYNVVISQFIELEVNNNELIAEEMIVTYPVLMFFLLGFVGPFCEELTYRYGLFNLLRRKNRILAYIVSALVFGIIHFDFTGNLLVEALNLPVYVICGALFALAYDLCGFEGSLTAHIANNIYAVILTLIQNK